MRYAKQGEASGPCTACFFGLHAACFGLHAAAGWRAAAATAMRGAARLPCAAAAAGSVSNFSHPALLTVSLLSVPTLDVSGFCYINDIVLAILELLKVHQR